MQKNIISLLVLYVVILSLSGCGKMDATYVDFIKDGKIIYPGKADSLKVYPGKYRIQLSWLLIDPNVTNTVIYWDNRADSVEVAVGSPGRVQDAQVMLTGMDEGTYFFEFYTFDDERNKSVKVEVTGQIYGDLYSSSLLTIPIQKVTSNADSTVIVWEASEDGDFIGIELEYTNKEGEIKHLFSNIDDGTITLRDLKLGTNFRYRSLFLPSPLALDTFYSDYTERFIEPARILYPKGTWSIVGFSSEEPNNNRLANRLIDGDLGTSWIARYSSNPTNYPDHWVSVDMKEVLEVNGFVFVQKSGDRKIRELEVQISNDNESWERLGLFTLTNNDGVLLYLDLEEQQSFRYFKLVPKSGHDDQLQPGLAEVATYRFEY